jgi:type IV pilus assembly protein PilF
MMRIVILQLGENAQAAHSFQSAIALVPEDPDIRNNYGIFLCHGRQPQSRLAQRQLAWQNPQYDTPGNAQANVSRCAPHLGDTTLVAQYRQRAERLGVVVDATAPSSGTYLSLSQ